MSYIFESDLRASYMRYFELCMASEAEALPFDLYRDKFKAQSGMEVRGPQFQPTGRKPSSGDLTRFAGI